MRQCEAFISNRVFFYLYITLNGIIKTTATHNTYGHILTHWGRATHIYVSNPTIRNKLKWNINRNSYIFIHENTFQMVVWEMAAILSRPRCVKACTVFHTYQEHDRTHHSYKSLLQLWKVTPIPAWGSWTPNDWTAKYHPLSNVLLKTDHCVTITWSDCWLYFMIKCAKGASYYTIRIKKCAHILHRIVFCYGVVMVDFVDILQGYFTGSWRPSLYKDTILLIIKTRWSHYRLIFIIKIPTSWKSTTILRKGPGRSVSATMTQPWKMWVNRSYKSTNNC